jgi:NADH-quinone oxidoreductase subunit J
MTGETLLLVVLAAIAILFSLGVFLVKDNFFSAMYMSATLIMVATISAFFGIQPSFILIVFIFVGAIGVVTVALAATYRREPERPRTWWWILALLTAVILGASTHLAIRREALLYPDLFFRTIQFELTAFLANPEYILLVVALTSLAVLIMLSVLKMIGGNECQ